MKCKKYHDDWLVHNHNYTSVLRLDTNEDVVYDFTDKNDQGIKWLEEIETYIQKLRHENRLDHNMMNIQRPSIFEGYFA